MPAAQIFQGDYKFRQAMTDVCVRVCVCVCAKFELNRTKMWAVATDNKDITTMVLDDRTYCV